MRVALLEFPDEVARFTAWCHERQLDPAECKIVALWPDVQIRLRRAGLAYDTTLPYFSSAGHASVLQRSEAWLHVVEEELHLVDDGGLTDSYNAEFVFYLRLYINYFLWAVEILKEICAAVPSARLIVCGARGRSLGATAGPALSPADRLLGPIAARYAAARGLECIVIDRHLEPDASHGGITGKLKRTIWKATASAARILQRWTVRRYADQEGIVIVTALTYQMDRLVRDLRREFPRSKWILMPTHEQHPARRLASVLTSASVDAVLPLDVISSSSPGEASETALTQSVKAACDRLQHEQREDLTAEDVSLVGVFAEKIRDDLCPYIVSLGRVADSIRRALKRLRPKLVISPWSLGANALLGEAARQAGIASLSVSHGTFVPPRTPLDAIEGRRLGAGLMLTTYGYTALQTPWAERYLAHFANGRTPIGIRTGSLIFARVERRGAGAALLSGASTSTRIIVYATTLKGRAGMRFHSHETLDEHLVGIREMARAVAAIPDAMLIVKLHPAAVLKQADVLELIPEASAPHVRVMLDTPFERVLAAADLVVSYSSTCIEEALQNGIPVLLFDPWWRYQHLPAVSLDDVCPEHPAAVYTVSNRDALSPAIKAVLALHSGRLLTAEELRDHVYPESIRRSMLAFFTPLLGAALSPSQGTNAP